MVEVLEAWPDVAFSPELRRYLEGVRERVRKKQEYYRLREQQQPKTGIKPFTPEEKKARRRLIEENRRKREAEA